MAKKYTVHDKVSWPNWFKDLVYDKYWREQREKEEERFGF